MADTAARAQTGRDSGTVADGADKISAASDSADADWADSVWLESQPSAPVLGDILRRARTHCGFSLRQVEQRAGIANAHLSQIERGSIKHPDITLLMDLAELYQLNYRFVAEWAGYLDRDAARGTSSGLAGIVLRLFVDLDPRQQHDALRYLERLRSAGEGEPT